MDVALALHTAFDLLAWLTALLTVWLLYRWRLHDQVAGVAAFIGRGYFVLLSAGGILGAYTFGSLNLWLSGVDVVGRSVLGGLVGAIAGVEAYKYLQGIRGSTGTAFALPLCVAIAIGRVGCFLSGADDHTFGTPTGLPWGVDLGDGVSRHPVQLYESASMAVMGMVLLLGMQRQVPLIMRSGFYLTVGWYAVQRFAWEFFKPYASIVGPLNLFHLLCLALFSYAVLMLFRKPHVTA